MPNDHYELLARIDERTKNIDKHLAAHIDSVKGHIQEDQVEFKSVKKRIFWLTMAVVAIGVLLGGPSFAMIFLK